MNRITHTQKTGHSQGGWAAEILTLTDVLGKRVRFLLLPSNHYDTVNVASLIHGLSFDALLADKGIDTNWIVEEIRTLRATICISQRPQRKEPLAFDEEKQKRLHLVENFFGRLKDFPRIFLPTDKIVLSFAKKLHARAAGKNQAVLRYSGWDFNLKHLVFD
jgi:transposase